MNEEQLIRVATRLRRAERAIIGLSVLLAVVTGAAAAESLVDLICRSVVVKNASGKTAMAIHENGDVEVGGKLVVNGVDLLAELKRIVDDKGVIHARGLSILRMSEWNAPGLGRTRTLAAWIRSDWNSSINTAVEGSPLVSDPRRCRMVEAV